MTSTPKGPLHISQLRNALLEKIQYEYKSPKPNRNEAKNEKRKQRTPTDPKELLKCCRTEWPKLCSKELAKHSLPAGIKDEQLIVHVSHSVYMTEFQFQKEKLSRKIQALSKGEIQSILLRLKPGIRTA